MYGCDWGAPHPYPTSGHSLTLRPPSGRPVIALTGLGQIGGAEAVSYTRVTRLDERGHQNTPHAFGGTLAGLR
ncbi:hypothetical protein SSP35_01_00900 [Streptomyces sp. NBRC 110611]|nr:hypothetical protein SSP35_01_00900 [Streptomyces sp. NBRC 110611]